MRRIRKEKSIIGKIDSMSQKLVILLVFPIFISLALMLLYSGRYHSAINRMETIASLKTVVTRGDPGKRLEYRQRQGDRSGKQGMRSIHECP